MTFFDSDLVKAEMAEISDLQENVYKNVFNFYRMDKHQKVKHVDLLQKLLEKQRVLYTRMSLSDDPEAQDIKNKILESAKSMGLGEGVDISLMFGNMEKTLVQMKRDIDRHTDH